MTKLRLLYAVAAALLAVAAPAGAVTIDDFSVADSIADVTIGSPVIGAATPLGGSSVFDTRTTTVEMLGNSMPMAGGATSSDIGGGGWALSNSFFVTGRTTLLYLPVALSTIDLVAGTDGLFRFGFLGGDGASTITIVASSAGGAESTAMFVPGVAPTSIDVLFSSFITSGIGPADFSTLTSLAIIGVNTAAGADLAFDSISVPDAAVGGIPEPATLTLFGGALLGLALLRKRRALT